MHADAVFFVVPVAGRTFTVITSDGVLTGGHRVAHARCRGAFINI